MALPLTALPGQDKRLLGSMAVTFGTGIVLDTSYYWVGISIILVGLVVVGLGWKARWQQKEPHAQKTSR